jgi:DeoR/GlpR family transcriptional regulator of sugar metabolism
MRVSGRTTVMADSTKFARTAFAHICDLKSILKIVTDGNLSSEIAKSYAAKQIKIQRV